MHLLTENNLYGWSLKEPLPYAEFKWLHEDEIAEKFPSEEAIRKLSDDGNHGYFLEVDLEYPEEIHEEHSDYPVAPEKIKVYQFYTTYLI